MASDFRLASENRHKELGVQPPQYYTIAPVLDASNRAYLAADDTELLRNNRGNVCV